MHQTALSESLQCLLLQGKRTGSFNPLLLYAPPPRIPGEKGRTSEERQLSSAPGSAQTSLGSGWHSVPPLSREDTAKALPSLLLNTSSHECGNKSWAELWAQTGTGTAQLSHRHGRVCCSFPAAGGPWARERLQLIDVSTKARLHSMGLHWDPHSLGEAMYWETKAGPNAG